MKIATNFLTKHESWEIEMATKKNEEIFIFLHETYEPKFPFSLNFPLYLHWLIIKNLLHFRNKILISAIWNEQCICETKFLRIEYLIEKAGSVKKFSAYNHLFAKESFCFNRKITVIKILKIIKKLILNFKVDN